MVQSIYIFQRKTSSLLYTKNFLSDENVEMFSAFFTALKGFVSEISLKDSSKLSSIELGGYLVLINPVKGIASDLVIITNKEDAKATKKLIPKLIKIILNHQSLFKMENTLSSHDLEEFNQDITNFILSNKKLLRQGTLVDDQSVVLKSIWNLKGDLSSKIRDGLIKEKEELLDKHSYEENLIRKAEIVQDLIEIAEKLQEDEDFIEFQAELSEVKTQIRDQKLRLDFYADRIKKAIKGSAYREVYPNLYSFCSNLKNLADSQTIAKYSKLANTVINRNNITEEEFFETLKEISEIDSDIDFTKEHS